VNSVVHFHHKNVSLKSKEVFFDNQNILVNSHFQPEYPVYKGHF